MKLRFTPGPVVMTKGIAAWLADSDQVLRQRWLLETLSRHLQGDWGDTVEADAELNNQAVTDGVVTERVLSAYKLPDPYMFDEANDNRVWIITEPTCEVQAGFITTILFPSEY